MSRDELHAQLQQLRQEVDKLAKDDNTTRARLDTLINEIEADIDTTEQDRLGAKIQQAIEQFEVEHPRATAILNDVMVTLSNMGI